jgi:hypothetical protein
VVSAGHTRLNTVVSGGISSSGPIKHGELFD